MGTRCYLVFAALIAASMVLGTGCRNRSRSGGPRGSADSGMIRTDGGGAGTDSGGITIPDAGPRDSGGIVVRDTGGPDPECVSHADCPSTEMCSGGFCVPRMTMSCPTDTVTTITMQICADTTRTCVEGCADSTCLQSCLDADPDPANCVGCVNNNIFACFNRNGCQSQWNCVAECIDTRCTPDDTTCLDTTCATEWGAYETCYMGVPDSAMCGTEWAPCVGL